MHTCGLSLSPGSPAPGCWVSGWGGHCGQGGRGDPHGRGPLHCSLVLQLPGAASCAAGACVACRRLLPEGSSVSVHPASAAAPALADSGPAVAARVLGAPPHGAGGQEDGLWPGPSRCPLLPAQCSFASAKLCSSPPQATASLLFVWPPRLALPPAQGLKPRNKVRQAATLQQPQQHPDIPPPWPGSALRRHPVLLGSSVHLAPAQTARFLSVSLFSVGANAACGALAGVGGGLGAV